MSQVVSLFSGCGGLDLGFIQAGAEIIWANDHDHYACETYRHNIGGHIIEGDIADVFETMPCGADGVIGGFPCVDFSGLGKRRGLEGESGGLYQHLINAICRCNPAWFLAENVPRLLSDNGAWDIIHKAFSSLGYQLSPVVINFADYGVAQKRRRLLIVGTQFDWMLPLPTTPQHITVGEVFEGIPPDAPNNEKFDLTDREAKLLPFINEGENLRIAYERSSEVRRVSNYRNPPFNDIMRRLSYNLPAWTITGAVTAGGGLCRFHPKEDRVCTMREMAALQGFPHNFLFKGSRASIRGQIANAVPPLGIRRIAKSLIRREFVLF